jgi:predicted DNA-binding transcriptional regulator AlpA
MTASLVSDAVAKKAAAGNQSTKIPDELIEANAAAATAAALKPTGKRRRRDRNRVHAPPPPVKTRKGKASKLPDQAVAKAAIDQALFRLLDKAEVLRILGVSNVTLWSWMRDGKFPRAREIGKGKSSKSVWRSDEVEKWVAALPVRRLKGDAA